MVQGQVIGTAGRAQMPASTLEQMHGGARGILELANNNANRLRELLEKLRGAHPMAVSDGKQEPKQHGTINEMKDTLAQLSVAIDVQANAITELEALI